MQSPAQFASQVPQYGVQFEFAHRPVATTSAGMHFELMPARALLSAFAIAACVLPVGSAVAQFGPRMPVIFPASTPLRHFWIAFSSAVASLIAFFEIAFW